jgi:hypothetical protein
MSVTKMLLLPLALTQASAYALYPLMGLYLILSVYTIFGGWSHGGQRRSVRRWQLITVPTLSFFALWLCGSLIWTLLLWLWPGEAYMNFGSPAAATLAAILAAVLLIRQLNGRVTDHYLRLSGWGAAMCLGLLCAMYAIEFVDQIDGWTARGAAEKKFAFLMRPSQFYPARLPRRISDETPASLAASGGKAFALYVGEKRAAEVHVYPYYYWWWTVGSFRTTPFDGEGLTMQEQFEKFRESIEK